MRLNLLIHKDGTIRTEIPPTSPYLEELIAKITAPPEQQFIELALDIGLPAAYSLIAKIRESAHEVLAEAPDPRPVP